MKYPKRIFLISTLYFAACGGPSEITESVEGKYKFRYPSGQIEILDIKKDHTYSQEIYTKESDINNIKPQYENKGSWTSNDAKLEFNHWLAISYLGQSPDSILTHPEYYTTFDVTWHAPTSTSKAQIYVYVEDGYVLTKIE